MTNINRRLLAPFALQDRANEVIDLDLSNFINRVLLFDTYVVQSIWLEDLFLLGEVFGGEGLLLLLESGAIEIFCESYSLAETGRARADLNFSDNNSRLPLGSYSFSRIRVQDQQGRIEKAVSHFGDLPDTPSSTKLRLQEAISGRILSMPDEFPSLVSDGFYGDLRRDKQIVKNAIDKELRKLGVKTRRLQVSIEEVAKEDFRLQSNLMSEYGLSEERAHQIGERALLSVGGINQRFAEMKSYAALSGFKEEDLDLVRGKLGLVSALASGANSEQRLERVLEIAELPVPRFREATVSAKKLLQVRDSDECRAFRDWLAGTDSFSDEELQQRLKGFKARISELSNSTSGRIARFVVSNGLSTLPVIGPAVGFVASVIDGFILERLAPRDSVVSFLGEDYPSLFKWKK